MPSKVWWRTPSSRRLPQILVFALVTFLLVSYYRCSPYVCSSHSSRLASGDGYPRDFPRISKGHRKQNKSGYDLPPKNLHAKATIVSAMKGDDVSWLQGYFPDWDHNIYVMNDPKAKLTVAKNKGRESMAYLSYLIDNYHDLPAQMVFLHSLRYQWHNEDPMYDGVPPLQNLQLSYVDKVGYSNMRCTWVLGCPNEIKPAKAITKLEAALEPGNERANTEAAYAHAFLELFPGLEIPEEVGIPCGAQFALARWKVLERPKADYERYRDWLWNTPLHDSVSGRILEYSWHIIMGLPYVSCPPAQQCFCEKFGLCNLTCPDASHCEKRFILPKYATIPRGWPDYGPGEKGFPAVGWAD